MQDKDKNDYWVQWEKILEVADGFEGILIETK